MKKTIGFTMFALLFSMLCTNNKFIDVNADENKVSINAVEAYKFAGAYDINSSYVSDGVQALIPGADSVGSDAWWHKVNIPNDNSLLDSFSIKNDEKVTIEFSINYFDDDGNSLVSSNNSSALDIYVLNAANDSQIAMLRIWTDAGGGTNGSHSYQLFGSDWNGYNGATWIAGDARANSSFLIQFDKENLFSSYVGGSSEITHLDTADNAYKAAIKDTIASVDNIKFQIGGDNGWTKTCSLVLKSINGQQLANQDGMIVDTIAPKFKNIPITTTINQNEEFTILEEAYDLFGGVSYSMNVNGTNISGKTFTPAESGNIDVTLYATDLALNTSSKNYTFAVSSNISAPVITTLPTIEGGSLQPFTTVTFDSLTYTDETNNATVTLDIYKDSELYASLNANDDGKFSFFVPSTMEDGTYNFQYRVSNIAGETKSDLIPVEYSLVKGNECLLYLDKNENTLVEYVPEGIRLATSVSYTETSIAEFDIQYGLDVKFIVNPNANNNLKNDTNYVNMILTNKENPNYKVMYRVWVDFSGSDRPTNVYISYDGGVSYNDITDTGWISRTVDDVENQYHMAFNMEEYLCGERLGGMQKVDMATQALEDFFTSIPSTNFVLSFETSRLASANQCNYEMILTSLNGQSFKNTNGVLNQIEDAFLYVASVKEKVEVNETITLMAYAKDLFSNNNVYAEITSPDNNVETKTLENGKVDITFTTLGDYKVKVYYDGANGHQVSETKTISCLSSTQEIEMTINGTYQANYAVNEAITILSATYSENVVTKEIVVKKPDGTTIKVSANDTFTFDKPGLYTITYIALDNALPTPNEKKEVITINVPDNEKPVVEVSLEEQYKVGDEITPIIVVTDDSEFDTKITLISATDNKVTNVSTSIENVKITDLDEGTYTLKVIVEDIYGNKTEVSKTFTVNANKKSGCKGSLSSSLLTLMACAFVLILKKSKGA
ncbi:MAG: Ig-like domain-containing protein [Erysipelotrichaceae bacterium]|nr:Ig-like domain-containing protein [Erysipelotrichaceae bacterium]